MVAKGYCATKNEAFEKFIGNFKPAYYPKPEVSVEDSLKVIHDAGAWAVIAHPASLPTPPILTCSLKWASMVLKYGIPTTAALRSGISMPKL
jgi:predicted metal-dependent phosphoesterase TrpH